MTTNALTQMMLEALERIGVYAWRQNTRVKAGRLRCTSRDGISDICAILPNGLFLGVEIKRKGETLRDSQIEFLQEVSNRSAKYFTCASADDVERIIKEITYHAEIRHEIPTWYNPEMDKRQASLDRPSTHRR